MVAHVYSNTFLGEPYLVIMNLIDKVTTHQSYFTVDNKIGQAIM